MSKDPESATPTQAAGPQGQEENGAGGPPPSERPRHRRSTHRSPWLVLVVVLLVAVASYATYRVVESPAATQGCAAHPHALTIWTYESLFDSGVAPNTTRDEVFQGFENATHSTVTVDYLTGDLASALLNAKPCQLPDLVMGLDELEAPRVDAAGLLVPYTSPQLADVPSWVVADLSPDHTTTPYEYGYLGLDYNVSVDAGCGQCFSRGDFFQSMEETSSLASDLCYPDPLQGDITGEEFLAWEVEFSTHVLHQNWTTFWREVSSLDHPQPDWDTGWEEFTSGACPTFLSYLSDPAAEEYFGDGGWMNSTVAHVNGTSYGWITDYGTGIVKGTGGNLTLEQRFVDWTLSGTVQELVPTNEWEYPANDTVGVPGVYNWTESNAGVVPVNGFTTPAQSAASLEYWVETLESIVLP